MSACMQIHVDMQRAALGIFTFQRWAHHRVYASKATALYPSAFLSIYI